MTKMGKKKKKGLVAALSVVAVIVLLAAAYGIFCLIIEDDKIWADASINGVNIQGMSKKKAAQTVEQKFEEDYKDTAVTVELDGQQYTMNVFPMLGMDASAEIEKAYDAVRCCPLKSNDMAMKYEIQIIALTDKLGNKLDDNKIQEIPEIVQEILKNVKKRNAMLS